MLSLAIAATNATDGPIPLNKTISIRPRIINGNEANPGEFPFMVLILDESGNNWSSAGCGASLIHDDLILTAAHCVENRQDKIDAVYINAHSPYNNNSDLKWTLIRVVEKLIHPLFNNDGNTYDIAILRLETTVPNAMAEKFGEEFRNLIKPVKVNTDLGNESLSVLTVIGFGRMASGSASKVLQKAQVNFVSNSDCQNAYDAGRILPNMMCASDNGSKDACQGDSGGPLLVKDEKTHEYIQVGVVSWGTGCAKAGYPGVYARVRYIVAWLRRIGCMNSQSPQSGFCTETLRQPKQRPTRDNKKRLSRGRGGAAGGNRH